MELVEIFSRHFSKDPVLVARGPGRVNLLGEHVDYNDGLVLPAAIDREVSLAAAPSGDDTISLHAVDLRQQVSFRLSDLASKTDLQGDPLPTWALYPAGVAWSLQDAGLSLTGMQAVYTSTIPIGSGLSSSAAIEVAFAAAWQALCDWKADRLTLAKLSQKAENQYVGVSCGLMDQFASANGVAGHCLLFDTRSLDWQPVPLPQGTAIVIADSGVRRSLTTSGYNDRRAACEEAVALLSKYKPGLQSLRDISPVEFAAYSEFLPPIIERRAEHVVKEIARVESAVMALELGKTRSFGALMFAGHASLRDLYEVSTAELDTLVEIARDLPGCLGARLTGAGFGGCTVNLVDEEDAQEFILGLQEGYNRRTGRNAQVYLCQACDGVSVDILKT
jgi:galactokinase